MSHLYQRYTTAMLSEFERVHKLPRKNKTLIVTPDTLRTMDYHLLDTHNDVVFIGFDVLTPLRIPADKIYHVDIWIVDCHVESAKGARVEGSVHYITSDIMMKDDFYYVRGIVSMDEPTRASYFHHRIKHRILRNRVIFLNTVEGDGSQKFKLKDVLAKAPLFDLMRYLSHIDTVKVLYNKKTGAHTIEGNVTLKGPYAYLVPSDTTFKGDLTLIDFCWQPFLDTVKVEGNVEVLSYYI